MDWIGPIVYPFLFDELSKPAKALDGVLPKKVPVVSLSGTKVMITFPWIDDGFVKVAFEALSFTTIIFQVPTIDVGMWSAAGFLQEKTTNASKAEGNKYFFI
jgi:hypothetical protein